MPAVGYRVSPGQGRPRKPEGRSITPVEVILLPTLGTKMVLFLVGGG
jgi:hypothetical protein